MSSGYLYSDGTPVLGKDIIGQGSAGVVALRDGVAVKIPYQDQRNIERHHLEQQVYRRIGHIDGVVRCLDMSEQTLELTYMKKGDLTTYLQNNPASRALKLDWLKQLARALAQIHDHCVLINDIHEGNVVVDSDLSIHFCDFSEATLFPEGTQMAAAIDGRCWTIHSDIKAFGRLVALMNIGECPWLEGIVELCWTKGGFADAHALADRLEACCVNGEA